MRVAVVVAETAGRRPPRRRRAPSLPYGLVVGPALVRRPAEPLLIGLGLGPPLGLLGLAVSHEEGPTRRRGLARTLGRLHRRLPRPKTTAGTGPSHVAVAPRRLSSDRVGRPVAAVQVGTPAVAPALGRVSFFAGLPEPLASPAPLLAAVRPRVETC